VSLSHLPEVHPEPLKYERQSKRPLEQSFHAQDR
jgi:hypothetical protein